MKLNFSSDSFVVVGFFVIVCSRWLSFRFSECCQIVFCISICGYVCYSQMLLMMFIVSNSVSGYSVFQCENCVCGVKIIDMLGLFFG